MVVRKVVEEEGRRILLGLMLTSCSVKKIRPWREARLAKRRSKELLKRKVRRWRTHKRK